MHPTDDPPPAAELAPDPDRDTVHHPRTASRLTRAATGILLSVAALLLAVVILTPIALSSQDLLAWASAPTGLHLPGPWPILVFIALDAAAGVCVMLTIVSAWRGEPAGIFGLLVWCFAGVSAIANFRHGSRPDAAPDEIWFFPLMSVIGPALLEAVLGRLRRWVQRDTGRRSRRLPAFGWRRWIPGLGALRDTYGAYRSALLLGIDTVDAAVTAYHRLCPDGSLRVAAALRTRHTTPAAPPPLTHDDEAIGLLTLPDPAVVPDLPIDVMRRIPVELTAYRRWLDVWADLRADDNDDLQAVAERHQFSRRQIEWVRRAGHAGLLDSPIPPAILLAQMAHLAHTAGHPTNGHLPAPDPQPAS